MKKFAKIDLEKISKIRSNPDKSPIVYKTHGKSLNIDDYSDAEIHEMLWGIYKEKKILLVDGDYFINLNDIVRSECILATVSYKKKPTIADYKNGTYNQIDNIRTYYIADYYLVSEKEIGGEKKHKISRFLEKTGELGRGRGQYSRYYSTKNDYPHFQNGYPKDLYLPIKHGINRIFFNDDYKISDFQVISHIEIKP